MVLQQQLFQHDNAIVRWESWRLNANTK